MSHVTVDLMLYRTTVRIDDELLAELKALAARQHRTLNSVMEEAFRRMIAATKEQEQRPWIELTTSGPTEGGRHLTPEEIKQVLEDEDVEHFLEVTADAARRHQRDDLCSSA
jgi:predicted transcriptional regulator